MNTCQSSVSVLRYESCVILEKKATSFICKHIPLLKATPLMKICRLSAVSLERKHRVFKTSEVMQTLVSTLVEESCVRLLR